MRECLGLFVVLPSGGKGVLGSFSLHVKNSGMFFRPALPEVDTAVPTYPKDLPAFCPVMVEENTEVGYNRVVPKENMKPTCRRIDRHLLEEKGL